MSSPTAKTKPKVLLWVSLAVAGLIALGIILFYVRFDQADINSRYNTNFAGKAGPRSAEETKTSNNRGVGMSESNIKKIPGRRYSTY